MTNYSADQEERERTEERVERWKEAMKETSTNDQQNIKDILERTKACQQWDAQTQSYVEVYEDEEVTNPKHYDKVGFAIQPIEYITKNELDFLEGNVIKYVSRYQHKGGVNDLLKAKTYLEFLIKRERERNE